MADLAKIWSDLGIEHCTLINGADSDRQYSKEVEELGGE